MNKLFALRKDGTAIDPREKGSVGRTIPHDSAIGHVAGCAPFIDDLPRREDELFVGFVGSPIASGTIEAIHIEAAEKVDGVVCVLTAKDVGEHNQFGPIICDEPFLADSEVIYVGQPIVLIAAETSDALKRALKLVEIETVAAKPVLTIKEAVEQESHIGPRRQIRRGDPDQAIANATHQLSGQFEIGGQEQFYLESQVAASYPAEQGQLVVHSSTQNTTEIQAVVAEVLGISMHQVVCVCKRMGGAFGGKETQAVIPALMVALVTQVTGRAARIAYDKDTDMCVTGKRHAYLCKWSVGFDSDGIISGLKCNYFSDGGATADLSTSIMERTLLHTDNAYYIENFEASGQVCRTNKPPNTAFRGFGGPQGVAATENIIERIAEHLKIDAFNVRVQNLYGIADRNVTPYGQYFSSNHLPEILNTLASTSDYENRVAQIRTRNQEDPLFLRGISMTPVKFGISFTSKFLNQANALVNVYTDGTVQVSTGGTEMGQGLNTKIRQIVADEFGIDYTNVIVMPTSTEKNNNTSPTAASAGTDLNGAAAANACAKIKKRMADFAATLFASAEEGLIPSPQHIVFENGCVRDSRQPTETIAFADLANRARLERIDIGSRGFYKTPGVDFNRDTGRGNPFLYFTQGAAVAEVKIDRFTGDLAVTRVDLLMDIGKSINPGVDMGQITGGFIQGMGWVTAECLVYDERGALLSHSPTTYKIPAITDVPPDFRCEMFPNNDNLHTIRRSKAVGEPPLLLGVAAWAAVKNALSYLPRTTDPQLCLPATGEEILRCISQQTAGVSST
ncbi:Xanthine dehydrogenase molybdenum-binding subunit [Rubripirellula obstinata]|uniref:Xanthine dehydrogenase molybdenum-binding subunit n=1 Tax=Rubripirellula obstinata TaxID=406547 RepID=A0A5B1CEF2_9BACT|nr:xanthine dehydrogenase molybdopterin binding subunit [Rubripirellula obstinata]KAA1259527.1 Xanthine dehydrogenase molybdenum-binding subunit [Rubripirellula obstinata]